MCYTHAHAPPNQSTNPPQPPPPHPQVPVSGKGFSTGLPLLNRWQWAASAALVARGIHAKTARKVVQRAVAQLQVGWARHPCSHPHGEHWVCGQARRDGGV